MDKAKYELVKQWNIYNFRCWQLQCLNSYWIHYKDTTIEVTVEDNNG